MGLLGIFLGLALLTRLAYRGWSVLLVGPLAALMTAALSGQPLLAHWTQTLMGGAARFVAQFFPLFLLGALFGKLMDDTGSALAIARALADRLGRQRAILAVVLACGDTDLWRRQPVRRRLRGGCGCAVPRNRGTASPDAGRDRGWRFHLHHDRNARQAAISPRPGGVQPAATSHTRREDQRPSFQKLGFGLGAGENNGTDRGHYTIG